VDFLAAAPELSRVAVERQIAKAEPHSLLPRKNQKKPMTFQTLVLNAVP
jgi:hypothetical protein